MLKSTRPWRALLVQAPINALVPASAILLALLSSGVTITWEYGVYIAVMMLSYGSRSTGALSLTAAGEDGPRSPPQRVSRTTSAGTGTSADSSTSASTSSGIDIATLAGVFVAPLTGGRGYLFVLDALRVAMGGGFIYASITFGMLLGKEHVALFFIGLGVVVGASLLVLVWINPQHAVVRLSVCNSVALIVAGAMHVATTEQRVPGSIDVDGGDADVELGCPVDATLALTSTVANIIIDFVYAPVLLGSPDKWATANGMHTHTAVAVSLFFQIRSLVVHEASCGFTALHLSATLLAAVVWSLYNETRMAVGLLCGATICQAVLVAAYGWPRTYVSVSIILNFVVIVHAQLIRSVLASRRALPSPAYYATNTAGDTDDEDTATVDATPRSKRRRRRRPRPQPRDLP